jgi:hypothetical protein
MADVTEVEMTAAELTGNEDDAEQADA